MKENRKKEFGSQADLIHRSFVVATATTPSVLVVIVFAIVKVRVDVVVLLLVASGNKSK